MDRTNWKFSNTNININILTLGIIYEGMAFPIVFKMMDKRGNSNTEERMELVQRFISLAGKDSIAHLMADREFVGSEWFAFLNSRGIHYHIRIRENFRVIRLPMRSLISPPARRGLPSASQDRCSISVSIEALR